MNRAARNALFFLFGFGAVVVPAFADVPAPVTAALSQAQLDCIDVAAAAISLAFVLFWARVIKRMLER